jgi:SAM-dependent methyltransferase
MIAKIAVNLTERNGVYFSTERSAINYPEGENEICMQFEAESFWFNHRNRCVQAMLKNYPPQGSVLDIGGGNGFVSMAIREAGFPTILLEPGEAGIRNAQRRGLQPLICATFEDADFKDASIPAAGMFDVLEHIEDDRGFLQKLHSKLQDHGRVYLTVPAYNFLWSPMDKHAGHFRRYTRSSIVNVLGRSGFSVEYATYIFTALPLPIFLFRTLPGWLGMKGSSSEIRERSRKQHGLPDGLAGWIWNRERRRVSRRESIGFGASLMVAAIKT